MRNALLSLAAAALFAAAPARTDQIDDIVIEQMKVSHLPGVAVAIVDSGRVTKLATDGEANLEWPARVDPRHALPARLGDQAVYRNPADARGRASAALAR